VLVVLNRDDELNLLSVRNLDNVHVLWPDQMNTYDVIYNDAVVFTKDAYEAFVAGPIRGRSAKATARSSEVEEEDK
jgi:large subunit ribosomal protein L4